jgi:hypothetical protein
MYTKLLPLSREFAYPITLFVYTDTFTRAPRRASPGAACASLRRRH